MYIIDTKHKTYIQKMCYFHKILSIEGFSKKNFAQISRPVIIPFQRQVEQMCRCPKIWPIEHVCHVPDYKSFFQFSIVGALGISRRPRRRYILRSLYAFILTKFSPSPVTVYYFPLSRWERNTISNWEILKENVVSDPLLFRPRSVSSLFLATRR